MLSQFSRRQIMKFARYHIAKNDMDILLVAPREPPSADHVHILVSDNFFVDLAYITQYLH